MGYSLFLDFFYYLQNICCREILLVPPVPGHNGLADNLSESHERCENWAKYTIHLYPINTQPYQQHSLQLVSARESEQS